MEQKHNHSFLHRLFLFLAVISFLLGSYMVIRIIAQNFISKTYPQNGLFSLTLINPLGINPEFGYFQMKEADCKISPQPLFMSPSMNAMPIAMPDVRSVPMREPGVVTSPDEGIKETSSSGSFEGEKSVAATDSPKRVQKSQEDQNMKLKEQSCIDGIREQRFTARINDISNTLFVFVIGTIALMGYKIIPLEKKEVSS